MTEQPRTTAPETPVSGTGSTREAGVADWPDLLMKLMHGQDLDEAEASWAMDQIMSGEVPDVTMAAFLAAHHTKGETVAEIAGLVSAMMDHAVPRRASRTPSTSSAPAATERRLRTSPRPRR